MKNKIQKSPLTFGLIHKPKRLRSSTHPSLENSKIGRITSYGNEGNQIHGKTMGSVMTRGI